MAARTKRIVTFVPKPGFKARYRDFLKLNPDIRKPIEDFNVLKRLIPPGRLPNTMKDHTLKGRLKGIGECHLAGDILLLYFHSDDVVNLLDVCTHDELHGEIGRAAAAYVKALKLRG